MTHYFKAPDARNSELWVVVRDDGHKQTTVAEGMAEQPADWLLRVLDQYERALSEGAS